MKAISFWATVLFVCVSANAQQTIDKYSAIGAADSFYKNSAMFSTRADSEKSFQTIDRFGPVGIGIELHQPAFVMKVKNVEKGSPAEKTGKLKAGQIIETINGQKLADIDPRIQLGKIIADAEATDGLVKFMVKDKPEAKSVEVVVEIPVIGGYSETWPLGCKKSEKIVRDAADYLAKKGWKGDAGIEGTQMLFLLSTGEEKDLETATKWAKKTIQVYKKKGPPTYASWFIGYGGVPLAEYYLRTGDKEMLPVIEKFVQAAEQNCVNYGWYQRGVGTFHYGHMNAAGSHVVAFLMLAKECGVEINEDMLQGSLRQFYRFAGRGNNPYGDHRPESGFVDNGKCGALAFTMGAAASLTPDGEKSVYAKARDVSAVKGFYSTQWMLHGHTGGGIGEIWRSAAMGLMYDKTPNKYREFMDNRSWFYDLSRRYDGSFGILGGGSYDKDFGRWGMTMALSYTMPRKKLRIAGAPKTKYSKSYRLPVRPWGTEADDAFLSIDAAVDKNGNSPDIKNESLTGVCASYILHELQKDGVSKGFIRKYAHHQDHYIRAASAMRLAGVKASHFFKHPTDQACYPELVTEFLQSKDPRVRRAAISAVKALPKKLLTDENFDIIASMIHDPKESWWVVDNALETMSYGKPEKIVPHIDRLLYWLDHQDWWMGSSTTNALLKVATDERYCDKIFPAIGRVIAGNTRLGRWSDRSFNEKLKGVSPRVRKAALKMFAYAYVVWPAKGSKHNEEPHPQAEKVFMDKFAGCMSKIPGGLDVLFDASRKRYPDVLLSHRDMFLTSKMIDENPKVKAFMSKLILDEMIPGFVNENWEELQKLATGKKQNSYPGGLTNKRKEPITELVNMYRNAGVGGFDWHGFGTDRYNNQWDYHTFDPPEERFWVQGGARYRDVTYPTGMENWFDRDFDAEKAGWKKGIAAFGHLDGKLPKDKYLRGKCDMPFCGCEKGAETYWDKEVLLMRRTFEMPAIKDGHRYRILVGSGCHVGQGDGYAIYINGKLLIEEKDFPHRNMGGIPRGAFITSEFFDDFKGGKVTVAVKSFLRRHDRRKKIHGLMNVWFEEMELPPMPKGK